MVVWSRWLDDGINFIVLTCFDRRGGAGNHIYDIFYIPIIHLTPTFYMNYLTFIDFLHQLLVGAAFTFFGKFFGVGRSGHVWPVLPLVLAQALALARDVSSNHPWLRGPNGIQRLIWSALPIVDVSVQMDCFKQNSSRDQLYFLTAWWKKHCCWEYSNII